MYHVYLRPLKIVADIFLQFDIEAFFLLLYLQYYACRLRKVGEISLVSLVEENNAIFRNAHPIQSR